MASTINASTTLGLQQTADTSGVLQLQTANTTAVTIDASQNVSFVNTINTPNTFGFKNRIINGGMGVAQRGTSFSTPSTGTYTLDRWQIGTTGSPPASVAQVAGPTGFRNAIQFTGASGNTATQLSQKIESLNCSDLSGATITIQANIAVSSPQTIAWFIFSANAQDNWTSSTQLASGTWSATSTATTFTATISNLASSATNGLALYICANNNGAFTSGTMTVTGVQLEKGSTATSFDYRPYGTELALCQRYFVRLLGNSNYEMPPSGVIAASTTNAYGYIGVPVQLRTLPSISGSNYRLDRVVAGNAASAIAIDTGYNSVNSAGVNVTSSGLTSGLSYTVTAANTTSAYIYISAEL
jgi:hypothetical protein